MKKLVRESRLRKILVMVQGRVSAEIVVPPWFDPGKWRSHFPGSFIVAITGLPVGFYVLNGAAEIFFRTFEHAAKLLPEAPE